MDARALLRLSIGVAVGVIALKAAAWWVTGAVSLLSDAMESFANLASASFAYLMVIVAARPADDDHPFGHSKAEYFASGFEGLLVVGAAVAIVWAALARIADPAPLGALDVGLALTVVASVVNGALSLTLRKASRRLGSIALEADARHLMSDVWTSAGIVVALLLVSATGWLWLDPAVALLVAALIAKEGGAIVWKSVDGLMDKAVPAEVQARIDRTIARFATPPLRFDHMVTRRAGRRHFVDVHLHVPADWTLGRAAALRKEVEQALIGDVPGVHASIQLLPTNVETEAAAGDEAAAV